MEDPSKEQLARTFPKTSETFEKMEILSNAMTRIDLVKWIEDIVEEHIHDGHDHREKFLFFTETLKTSFANTKYLYTIQATINQDEQISIFVNPENVYYDILFKAHEFWTTITIEFRKIFRIYMSGLGQYRQIPKKQLSEKLIQTIQAIATNENLMQAITLMHVNSATIFDYIQSWEAFKQPTIEL